MSPDSQSILRVHFLMNAMSLLVILRTLLVSVSVPLMYLKHLLCLVCSHPLAHYCSYAHFCYVTTIELKIYNCS